MSIATLKKLRNKKIAILGLGIENYALVKFLLAKKINCGITVCDSRDKEKLGDRYKELKNSVGWKLGNNYNKGLKKYDIVFRSPGYPLNKMLNVNDQLLKVVISSPMKLFFELCPAKNIIGVTGTKGKGTTASLIYEILKTDGKKVYLGGNIGIAPFEFLDKIKKNDWIVLELSSFQLEDMEVSPRIAVITNFSSEHLAPADPNNPNYHRSLRAYWEAKINIIKWQNKGDYAILNKNLELRIKNYELRGKKIFFTKSELPSNLIGEHNKENIAAAVEVAKIVGIKEAIIKKAVAEFKGLEHRLEFVKNIKGVKYYNDTFATTPKSAIIALKSFNAPVILIAGGSEKNSNFKEFVREVNKKIYPVKSRLLGGSRSEFNRVKLVILIVGDATPRIKKELLKINYPANKIKLTYNIKEAVKTARQNSAAGDIVLLSPACASFGIFKNYKERGELFKEAVKNL